jgi:hypothetical protein
MRYLIQHQQMNSNHRAEADSLGEAMEVANRIWGPDCDGVRQEISDEVTGQFWVRANGNPRWDGPSSARRENRLSAWPAQ